MHGVGWFGRTGRVCRQSVVVCTSLSLSAYWKSVLPARKDSARALDRGVKTESDLCKESALSLVRKEAELSEDSFFLRGVVELSKCLALFDPEWIGFAM